MTLVGGARRRRRDPGAVLTRMWSTRLPPLYPAACRCPPRRSAGDDADSPRVTVLIPAHNETDHIHAKPGEHRFAPCNSPGGAAGRDRARRSTDATVEVVERFAARG